jgi:hypothetical protein
MRPTAKAVPRALAGEEAVRPDEQEAGDVDILAQIEADAFAPRRGCAQRAGAGSATSAGSSAAAGRRPTRVAGVGMNSIAPRPASGEEDEGRE